MMGTSQTRRSGYGLWQIVPGARRRQAASRRTPLEQTREMTAERPAGGPVRGEPLSALLVALGRGLLTAAGS